MSKIEIIKDRYNNLTNTLAVAQNANSLYKDFRNKYHQKFMYTAVVEDDAFVYMDLMEYINTKTNTRNFKFLSTRNGVMRYYDSESTANFYIGEHKLKAELRKPENSAQDNDDADYDAPPSFVLGGKDSLVFTARTSEGLQALEDLMEEFRAKKQAKKSTIYIANVDTWGDWDYKNLPAKDMDSVFLPQGVKEDLVLDIEKFLSREKQFEIVGMPWHRGYVFYGEPGNGKSSIALALANHFEMDLFNLPLSSVREDKVMAKAIARLKKGSILLLEDIDIFSESISRESGHHGPTLAGLLNALDGVATPHGLITIMTTNHFEKLDPALIRKGRMDYKLELTSPDYYQINGLFKRVYGEDLNMEIKPFKAMADVADIFKRNFDDVEAARMELKDDSGE